MPSFKIGDIVVFNKAGAFNEGHHTTTIGFTGAAEMIGIQEYIDPKCDIYKVYHPEWKSAQLYYLTEIKPASEIQYLEYRMVWG